MWLASSLTNEEGWWITHAHPEQDRDKIWLVLTGETGNLMCPAALSLYFDKKCSIDLWFPIHFSYLCWQWDVLSNGNLVQEVAHIVSGSHPGNCITVLRVKSFIRSILSWEFICHFLLHVICGVFPWLRQFTPVSKIMEHFFTVLRTEKNLLFCKRGCLVS